MVLRSSVERRLPARGQQELRPEQPDPFRAVLARPHRVVGRLDVRVEADVRRRLR